MDDCLCVCELLKAAAALSERRLNDALSELGVSHCQAQILLTISEQTASMSELSRILCCHKSNVTQVVDGLAKKGLIERVSSKEDRRVCDLKLTTKGRSVGGTLHGILKKEAGLCMKIFSADEKKALAKLLRTYIEAMEAHE